VSGAIVLALSFPYADEKTRFQVLAVFMGIICIQAPAEFFVATFTDTSGRIAIFGDFAIAVQLMFFASPLAGIVEIIRTKDSKSLYWPLALTASLSSALWAIYGASIGAIPILAPNGISAFIGLVQVALCLIYKSSAAPHRVSVDVNDKGDLLTRKSKHLHLLESAEPSQAEPSKSSKADNPSVFEAGMSSRPNEPSIYNKTTVASPRKSAEAKQALLQ
jgi:uncharacterized protein with PQ loop repeat